MEIENYIARRSPDGYIRGNVRSAEEYNQLATVSDATSEHPELLVVLPQYELLRDCVGGALTVKAKAAKYFPRPFFTADNIRQSELMYERYVARAQVLDHVNITVERATGVVFLREPVIELPDYLKFLENDVNGRGLKLVQLAKELFAYVYTYGRAALLVEFPAVSQAVYSEGLSSFDMKQYRPKITIIPPWDFINWIGEPQIHTVVCRQPYEVVTGFAVEKKAQYKAFAKMSTGGIMMSLYRQKDDYEKIMQISDGLLINAKKQPVTKLPVIPVGSENNDYKVDKPPMFRVGDAMISQARSSADNEEGVYMTGQPQYWINNTLKSQEFKKQYKDGIPVGARNVLLLPDGSQAGVLQTAPNQPAQELWNVKQSQIDQMTQTNLESLNVAKTASEVVIDAVTRNAALNSTAQNVNSAITEALRMAAQYVWPEVIDEQINFETDLSTVGGVLPAQDMQSILMAYEKGTMSLGEVRKQWKKFGLAEDEFDAVLQSGQLSNIAFQGDEDGAEYS